MANHETKTPITSQTTRHYVRVVAFVVLGISIGAIAVNAVATLTNRGVVVNEIPLATTTVESPLAPALTMVRSEPVSISIPTIGLETTFEEPLGLHPDQTVEVPDSFEKVGWYKFSPTPGELGPSVVLGHVDSYKGAAVFFSIGQLEAGDPIEIKRKDGKTATFKVVALERYEQEGFPTGLVYGDIDHAGLRLVTCSGTYDREKLRYSHNTVVYAELVEPEEGE